MPAETISTVLVAATATPPVNPYDLTDLATVHDELNLPLIDESNDPFLQRAITQASVAIANYCNRVFAVEALEDLIYIQQDAFPYQVPGRLDRLQLSRWPIVGTPVLSFTGSTHGTITVDGIASTAGLVLGTLVFASDGSLPLGTTIASIVGPNSITLSAAAETSVVGLSFTTGLQVIRTLSVGDLQTLDYGEDFTIDANKGWLIRLNAYTGGAQQWEPGPVAVQYQAGYATIPLDLVDATLRLVTARFRARGRDPMLVEQNQGQIGTQRYWVGSTPGQNSAFAPEIEHLIDEYRVPVIG